MNQSGVGQYYIALAAIRSGKPARAVLEGVVESGSDLYRTRSLLALGNEDYKAGRIKEAKGFYRQALGMNEKAGDYLTTYYIQHNLAIVESSEGNHRSALGRLERIGPMMKGIARTFPAHYFAYLHALSVELFYAGQDRAAIACLSQSLASPFASAYPEWPRSQGFISQPANRSTIAIATPLPMPDNQASIRLRRLAMNLLDFNKPKNAAVAAETKQIRLSLGKALAHLNNIKPATHTEAKQYVELIKETWNKKERWDGMKKLLALPSDKWDAIIKQTEAESNE